MESKRLLEITNKKHRNFFFFLIATKTNGIASFAMIAVNNAIEALRICLNMVFISV